MKCYAIENSNAHVCIRVSVCVRDEVCGYHCLLQYMADPMMAHHTSVWYEGDEVMRCDIPNQYSFVRS